MGFSDTLRRVGVYFGLAEDRQYDDYDEPEPSREPERELESRYQERPNVRRLSSRRRRDEIDDIFGDDAPSSSSSSSSERRTTQLRPGGGTAARPANGRGEVRVHIVVPNSFNDAKDVGDKFKESIPVIINLQRVDNALGVRFVDFTSGLIYALDGGMQRIADKVFLLTPHNVDVSAEQRAEL